jgi:RNA polymerase sigma-70 factor, ECF subfamily
MSTESSPTTIRARFEATALQYIESVYGVALRLTRRPEDARDLVQETYLRAYRTFGNFQEGTNCRAWLFTILYSIFANRYQKERRQPKLISVEELEARFDGAVRGEIPGGPVAEPPQTSVWTDSEVETALAELPDSFRATVLLVDVEELTYEETAAALDCPVGTVRSRLSRARKLLYAALHATARRRGYLKDTEQG